MQNVTTIFTRMLTNLNLHETERIRAYIAYKYQIEVLVRRDLLESFKNARLITRK